MAKQTYKISEFRDAYDRVNFIIRDFQGHVKFERLRVDLRTRFEDAIFNLEAMLPTLQKRFESDRNFAISAIKRAKDQIEWNESSQRQAILENETGEIYDPDSGERLSLNERLKRSTKSPNLRIVH